MAGRGRGVRVVFEVCGLLFATRIVFAPFPMYLLESAAFLPIVYTLIMSAVVVYVWVRRIPLAKLGLLRGTVPLVDQVLSGLLLGIVLGLVEHAILRPQPVDTGANLLHTFLFLVVV
ncbi:MAG: hypothetical protein GTO41_27950, partial [Burkholderiales bacterium]|nr:hypothetical protein [Burkholderiales bacterium]